VEAGGVSLRHSSTAFRGMRIRHVIRTWRRINATRVDAPTFLHLMSSLVNITFLFAYTCLPILFLLGKHSFVRDSTFLFCFFSSSDFLPVCEFIAWSLTADFHCRPMLFCAHSSLKLLKPPSWRQVSKSHICASSFQLPVLTKATMCRSILFVPRDLKSVEYW